MKQNEIILHNASGNLKSVVIELSEKLNQQELILECITNETTKNSSLMVQNLQKFDNLLKNMNKDPRNKIILFLVILIFILILYLLY